VGIGSPISSSGRDLAKLKCSVFGLEARLVEIEILGEDPLRVDVAVA